MAGRYVSEAEILRAVVDGDESAFDLLVQQHSQRVFRLAYSMLGNQEDAADVEQEAFLSAYRNLRRFRGDSSFGTWLCAITSRLCLANRRRRAQRREDLTDPLHWSSGNLSVDPGLDVMTDESAQRVRKALARMAPDDRLLVVLKFVEQLSHKEIAIVIGCTEESSRSRLLRAKRIFRDLYGGTE